MKIKYIFTCFVFSLITFFNLNITYAIEVKDENKLEGDTNLLIQKDKYILGPGDKLKITFLYAPSISGEYPVLSNGSLPLPLVGNLDVRGKNINQVQNILIKEFSKQLLRSDLSIQVTEFRPVKISIIGEVNKPGLLDFENVDRLGISKKMPTLIDAIQKAGGVTNQTNLRDVEVIRKFYGEEEYLKKTSINLVDIITKGDQSQNIFLYDGDIITLKKASINQEEFNSLASSNIFPENINVNVIGSVNSPGVTEMRANTPLIQAIMIAGGPVQWRSNKGNVELIRINQNGTAFRKRFRIDLRQSVSRENNPILKDGDLIKVNPSLIQNIASGVGAVTEPLTGILNGIAVIKLIDDGF